jgi:hypothetical protein
MEKVADWASGIHPHDPDVDLRLPNLRALWIQERPNSPYLLPRFIAPRVQYLALIRTFTPNLAKFYSCISMKWMIIESVEFRQKPLKDIRDFRHAARYPWAVVPDLWDAETQTARFPSLLAVSVHGTPVLQRGRDEFARLVGKDADTFFVESEPCDLSIFPEWRLCKKEYQREWSEVNIPSTSEDESDDGLLMDLDDIVNPDPAVFDGTL